MEKDSENKIATAIDISILIRKRASIKGRLTLIQQHIDTLQSFDPKEYTSIQIKELHIRLEKCQSLFSAFDDVQSDIEQHSDNLEIRLRERDVIEGQFINIISLIQELIEASRPKQEIDIHSERKSSMPNIPEFNIKLPTIKLPSFDGNYTKWLEFRDTFNSLINSNESIQDISKFHYLRSSLEGSALVVIKSIEFTSENYSVAWDLLRQRYDNKNILINNHLKALFALESITKESYKALRFVIDIVTKNLRSLNTLGLPTDSWDALIIYFVSSKLDTYTNCKWEEHKNSLPSFPTLEQFFDFLRNRAAILETTQASRNEKPLFNHRMSVTNKGNSTKSFATSFDESSKCAMSNKKEHSCVICNQRHFVYQCSKFKGMSVDDRNSEVLRFDLCSICLRKGHSSSQCRLKGSCRLCKLKHNTLLHRDKPTNEVENLPVPSLPIAMSTFSVDQVLLCTAIVKIKDQSNNVYEARALLDTGSQSSFVTEVFKQRLNLKGNDSNLVKVSGINNASFNIKECCHINVKSRVGAFNIQVQCLVVPQITGSLPSKYINIKNLNLPYDIELADPYFNRPSNIDILLGAGVFWDIVGSERIKLGNDKPTLQNSQFGWLISGPIGYSRFERNQKIHCNFSKEIHESLKLFWEIEELHSDKIPTTEENLCETHFVNNVCRLPNGRFSVKIPFKEEPEKALGDSYVQAKMRFFNLEKKLSKLPLIKQQYKDFICEYSDLGHLSVVSKPSFGYYLPHHAVIRDKSETTKLRVVFDASAKTQSGKSLNDIQMIGPVVQDDLLSILMRFRCHKYVLIADILKHYRQIEVDPSQRHLQLIVWRDDESQPLRVLQLNTVTYGTASAPFLSTRCLLQLARECSDPTVASIIEHDIYVDNLATGSSTEDGIKDIFERVSQVLNSACFPLHKIMTNASNFTQSDGTRESPLLNKECSVLGLNWSPKPDKLHFAINIESKLPITKRSILCLTCKIYDPLGLLCPCIIKAKIILQKLWSLKLGWDEPVPIDLSKQWSNLAKNLIVLLQLQIPRNVICDSPISVELHCFVDASQDAYGTCVYVRSINGNNIVSVQLLCAKARVAPIKSMTIPRLELCGALLGARLCSKLLNALNIKINQVIFWTDSTIVLCWIKTPQKLLKAFVCNRIQEINELTSGHTWRRIPTDQNPADLASRGVEPQDLLSDSKLWWEGPHFLKKESKEWPQFENFSVDVPELKVHINIEIPKLVDFCRYSSFNRLMRVYAFILRFIHNANKNNTKLTGALEVKELNKSKLVLIKISQAESFHTEIESIRKLDKLNNKSKIISLNPFLDIDGVLRVGGRLKLSNFDFNKKHPIILDAKHQFTILLMRHEHQRLFHAGPQLLLASLRENFWPLGGRSLARNVTKACTICKRFRGKTSQPIMGNLPSQRTDVTFPFYYSGTDFAGPFSIASKKGRGSRTLKCYLCIFVCLLTKAVHLEVVSDLSSEAFILCLRRFVSRRGRPHTIFCDNGTNFIGANNELGRILRSRRRHISDYASNEGIIMKFIPAYSPNFGGIWEAGVKSSKFHLKRIAGKASLTFEELTTLIAQIEAILNSRPLSPLSSDPQDLNPITPGHFLIGRPLMSVPSEIMDMARPNRYQLIEKLRQQFWERWSKEYVAELQVRTKWRTKQGDVKIGDMVLLKEENVPPLNWRLGRVNKLYPGADNVTRVVDVTTSKGILRRALNKLVSLEENNLESRSFQGGQDVNALKA